MAVDWREAVVGRWFNLTVWSFDEARDWVLYDVSASGASVLIVVLFPEGLFVCYERGANILGAEDEPNDMLMFVWQQSILHASVSPHAITPDDNDYFILKCDNIVRLDFNLARQMDHARWLDSGEIHFFETLVGLSNSSNLEATSDLPPATDAQDQCESDVFTETPVDAFSEAHVQTPHEAALLPDQGLDNAADGGQDAAPMDQAKAVALLQAVMPESFLPRFWRHFRVAAMYAALVYVGTLLAWLGIVIFYGDYGGYGGVKSLLIKYEDSILAWHLSMVLLMQSGVFLRDWMTRPSLPLGVLQQWLWLYDWLPRRHVVVRVLLALCTLAAFGFALWLAIVFIGKRQDMLMANAMVFFGFFVLFARLHADVFKQLLRGIAVAPWCMLWLLAEACIFVLRGAFVFGFIACVVMVGVGQISLWWVLPLALGAPVLWLFLNLSYMLGINFAAKGARLATGAAR